MSIVRWKPEQELMSVPSMVQNIQQSMSRMFDNLIHGERWNEDIRESLWFPAVDVAERENEYVVRMELPGVSKKDVHVSTRENVLTVRGEKKQEGESKDSNYRRVERSYGSFQRSFTLPGLVRSDETKASFSNGVLEIVLPKVEEAKPKVIDVKVS
ncbi:MAG: Hsp20/alpha crystallin family protein [Ignavibacteria bacterium]|nr:Hsp20/alpha crystallin family protein [Ignavibacteria bacterium]